MFNECQQAITACTVFVVQKIARRYCCGDVKPHVCIIRFHKPLIREDANKREKLSNRRDFKGQSVIENMLQP